MRAFGQKLVTFCILTHAAKLVVTFRKCSITIMTKDELGDIYQVVDNELKMGHGGERNGLRKPQMLRKMRS